VKQVHFFGKVSQFGFPSICAYMSQIVFFFSVPTGAKIENALRQSAPAYTYSKIWNLKPYSNFPQPASTIDHTVIILVVVTQRCLSDTMLTTRHNWASVLENSDRLMP